MTNFFKPNIDLAGINNYLTSSGIELTEAEATKLNTIFEASDVYDEHNKNQRDGKLNFLEARNFIEKMAKELPKLKDKISEFISQKRKEQLDAMADDMLKAKADALVQKNDAIQVRKPEILENNFIVKKANKEEVRKQIIEAMKTVKKSELSDEDLEYWSEVITNISNTAKIPSAFVTAIVARECGFKRNVKSSTGSGPMQVTGITTQDMYSNLNGGRLNLYKKLDGDLINNILYKKDEEGNFVKNAKGQYVNKFTNYKNLRDTCAKDDELGLQVGILCFKMKYLDAVRRMKKKSPVAAINGLKDGTIQLTPQEQIRAITTAMKDYNSVLGNYAKEVVDSIVVIGGKDVLLEFQGVEKNIKAEATDENKPQN